MRQSGLLLDDKRDVSEACVTRPLVRDWFFVEIWKVEIVYPLNSDCKGRSDWLADNNNLTSRASSSPTLVKGLCRNTISQYLDLWKMQ